MAETMSCMPPALQAVSSCPTSNALKRRSRLFTPALQPGRRLLVLFVVLPLVCHAAGLAALPALWQTLLDPRGAALHAADLPGGGDRYRRSALLTASAGLPARPRGVSRQAARRGADRPARGHPAHRGGHRPAAWSSAATAFLGACSRRLASLHRYPGRHRGRHAVRQPALPGYMSREAFALIDRELEQVAWSMAPRPGRLSGS